MHTTYILPRYQVEAGTYRTTCHYVVACSCGWAEQTLHATPHAAYEAGDGHREGREAATAY